jgi:nucleotide-binding universal stress UspA family protein
MIRHILVPTDGSDNALVAVRYAAALAKESGATLHGLYVVDVKLLEGPFLRDISASLGTAPFVNYQGNIAMILEERGNAALDAFRRVCEEADVKFKTSQATGVVSRVIVEHSELTDMIVMGRGGEHSQWLEGLAGSTTQAVIRRAGRPVLVTNTPLAGRDRLVVAYDGSNNAKEALFTAANLSAEWKATLHVLMVGDEDWVNRRIAEAQDYLAAHEIPAEFVGRAGDPSETIVAYAKECGADILVIGAYGHTKVRELVVGSATAYALNRAHCPVLLSR